MNIIVPAVFLVHFDANLDLILFFFQIVEFISVLLTIGSETAEKELRRQSAIKRSIDLFFEYVWICFFWNSSVSPVKSPPFMFFVTQVSI